MAVKVLRGNTELNQTSDDEIRYDGASARSVEKSNEKAYGDERLLRFYDDVLAVPGTEEKGRR